jgi:site-specific recombinase XerD
MIERYFSQAKVLIRLRSGSVGPYLPRFVSALEQKRFSRDTIRRYIRGADSLCRWLDKQGVAVVEANQGHVERYVRQHTRLPDIHYAAQGRLCKAALSVPFIATVLREQGILSGSAPVSNADAWLARFDNHLMRVHGLAPESRHHYLRYARRLIQSLQMSEPDWTALNAEQIRDFIRCEAGKRKTGSCQLVIAAIRAFLRFLAAEGVVPPNLHRAVPVVREWRHASLPQHISTEELERVLQICCLPTAGCSRDACIILMMARLGMRAGEVRQLNLNDIDWIEGEIHVRSGKSRRERTLPLLQEVGKALGVYLREERPESAERSVFLTLYPPYRPLACSATISQISRRIFEEAGVQGPRLGAHRLRHTVATHMVRRGSSFKEAADVLGHTSLKSTAIYAKLDERSLQKVALPWPGGVE